MLESIGEPSTFSQMIFVRHTFRFRLTGMALACALAIWIGAASSTALNAQEQPEITALNVPQDEAYLDAIWLSRIQNKLTYVDTTTGSIPMDGAKVQPPRPEAEPQSRVSWEDLSAIGMLSRILLFILLAVVIYIFVKHSGVLNGGFGKGGDFKSERTNGSGKPEPQIPLPEGNALIARLRQMPDKEEALVLLVGHTLDAAGRQNALRLRRSETAREFLARLPGNWPRLADLRRITMTEELVQFGGRPLADKTFEDCLRRAEPILNGVGA